MMTMCLSTVKLMSIMKTLGLWVVHIQLTCGPDHGAHWHVFLSWEVTIDGNLGVKGLGARDWGCPYTALSIWRAWPGQTKALGGNVLLRPLPYSFEIGLGLGQVLGHGKAEGLKIKKPVFKFFILPPSIQWQLNINFSFFISAWNR